MAESGGGESPKGGGALASILSLVVASPFALMLGTQHSAPPARNPAPTASVAAQPPNDAVEEPLEHCMDRFFATLDDFTGALPTAASPAASSVDVVGRLGRGGAFNASISPPPKAATEKWSERVDASKLKLAQLIPDGGPLEIVVATLPDPIDSGLEYQFDAVLQALRLGVEESLPNAVSHFRDRSWIPWDDRGALAKEREASEACRKTTPGIVTFRNTDTESRGAFLLLLVGETPTTGIHLQAMLRAFDIVHALDRTSAAGLRIVGPTFSGSAHSLRLALERTKTQFGSVSVISGSATGTDLAQVLRNPGNLPSAPTAGHGPAPWPSGSPPVSFASTTLLERSVECAYFSYLHWRLGVEPKDGILPGVAVLHESGTAFGANVSRAKTASGGSSASTAHGPSWCGLSPEVDISFPVHVSALRDAYAELDQRLDDRSHEAAPTRTTSLDISLRDSRRPQDIESALSQRTTFGMDLALDNALAEISREGVRHVAIHATDIADAIFLARKIRDVAPDVRIAFFEADVLLTHSMFRRDLLGSLVVTPYPFLGSDDFARASDSHRHIPFESASSLGIFNAMLAQRVSPSASNDTANLYEYWFGEAHTNLPVWIVAIGRSGFVPITAQTPLDCLSTIFPATPSEDAETSAICSLPHDKRRGAWERVETMRRASLDVDEDVTPPRLWHFAFAMLVLASIFDWRSRKKASNAFSSATFPDATSTCADRAYDLAIGRTKWRLYAAIRSFVLLYSIAYMTVVSTFAYLTYWDLGQWWNHPLRMGVMVLHVVVLGAALFGFGASLNCFLRSFYAFWKNVRRARGSTVAGAAPSTDDAPPAAPPDPRDSSREPDRWDRISQSIGFARPFDKPHALQTSFAQLRRLVVVTVALALSFSVLIWCDLASAVPIRLSETTHKPTALLTLFVLRILPLLNGVSTATPILATAGCVYLWAVGRMARLRLAHSLSRMSPEDGVSDVVSTPLRLILYPRYPCDEARQRATDAGMTVIERNLLNAIWRPSTGPTYFFSVLVLSVLPVILLFLKPPSSLEGVSGTCLLFGALWLCVLLVGATLIQLHQYWSALELLLKRVLEHPLGRRFGKVAPYVRESLDDQISGSANDLLRVAACAEEMRAVVESRPAGTSLAEEIAEESARADGLRTAREAALERSTGRGEDATKAEEALGIALITEAKKLASVVEFLRGVPVSRMQTADRDWQERAEACVATVAALLINRHVRQFRIFVSTLTGCALLLLVAFVSYPFEPQRLMLSCIWVIMLTVVASGFFVFMALDRNSLLSQIAGSEAGKVTVDSAFALRLVSWVFAPLLGVAAAQYPEVANVLTRIVEPLTRALN